MLDIRNLKCGYRTRFSLPFRFSSVHIWLHKSRPYKCQSWNDMKMRTSERRERISCVYVMTSVSLIFIAVLYRLEPFVCAVVYLATCSLDYKYKSQSFPISVRIAGAVQKLHFSETLTHTRAHSSILGIWRSFRRCHFFLLKLWWCAIERQVKDIAIASSSTGCF